MTLRTPQEQEDILQNYMNLFVKGLRREMEAGRAVNFCNWFNYLTVDIISDLCFGDSFLSLEKGREHPWIQVCAFMSSCHLLPCLHFWANASYFHQRALMAYTFTDSL